MTAKKKQPAKDPVKRLQNLKKKPADRGISETSGHEKQAWEDGEGVDHEPNEADPIFEQDKDGDFDNIAD